MMYAYIFCEQEHLDALIEAEMVADPSNVSDPLVRFYIAYQFKILSFITLTPVFSLLATKLYIYLKIKKFLREPSTPLLEESMNLAQEEVTSTDRYIEIKFQKDHGTKGYLVVERPCRAIHVKAHFFGGSVFVELFRNGSQVCV